MANEMKLPPWIQELSATGGIDVPEVSDRDMACLILPDLDYEAQLVAIQDMLRRHKEVDACTSADIKEVEEFARKTTGLRNEQAVDEWIDLLNRSTYQDAAHSMAALGMLAPLIESLFFQAFHGIRVKYYGIDVIPAGSVRSGMTNPDDFWDCHLVFNPGTGKANKGLISGIVQLGEAIHLTPHLPGDLLPTLKAIFQYRNKMFHFGFEWPATECVKFAKSISDQGWNAWFSTATRDGVPFIFYMSDQLISRTFNLVHELLEGFGAYCRTKVLIGEIPTET